MPRWHYNLFLALLPLSFSLKSTEECELPRNRSRDEREALFEYLLTSTLSRDAAAPIKYQMLGFNVTEAMLTEKEAFLNADEANEDLFYALVRLSNKRKDRHLSVKPVEGGIWLDQYWGERLYEQPPIQETPIKFAMDYNKETVFVGDVSVDLKRAAEIGDVLVGVNDVPFQDFVGMLEPYVRYSTIHGYKCKVAERMNQWNYQTPPSFYTVDDSGKRSIKYTLKRMMASNETTIYDITLPFQSRHEIQWMGRGQPSYPNFAFIRECPCFTIYLHNDKPVVLLVWHRFGDSLIDDMQALMDYAQAYELLNHSLIVDFTRSRGGSRAPYAIQHFSPRPFQTTFGNLRFSEITKEFVREHQKLNLGYYTRVNRNSHTNRNADDTPRLDDGTWLMDWIETAVLPFLEAGQDYTESVPFKLTHASMESDGILYPAPVHFNGGMVALFGPFGGSQVDQVASILVDNKLAHTIGMPTGGFSKAWDWSEVLTDSHERPIVSYMWSIGQTIRPNGEVLEGNPPEVNEYVPQTRENYLHYYDELIVRAMQYLGYNDPNNP
jgi:hypothetical protein